MEKCCYDCINHITEKGRSFCVQKNKELINPFEERFVCENFKCFQCTKKNIECKCYEEKAE